MDINGRPGRNTAMKVNGQVQKILSHYESDNPGTKANLARILMHGKLGGTGKLLILPVDQGSSTAGPQLCAEPGGLRPALPLAAGDRGGLSRSPRRSALSRAARRPLPGRSRRSSKVNGANSLARQKEAADQAVTASVKDALRLGCSAIGFTIYPGSDAAIADERHHRDGPARPRRIGLAVVIWSYPRGGNLTREGETAIDIIAYAAQLAAQLGAHIIKVKPPTEHLELAAAKPVYERQKDRHLDPGGAHSATLCSRRSNGKRIVVFSAARRRIFDGVLGEVRAVYAGGGNGSIIGRNTFQRPKPEALDMLGRSSRSIRGKTDHPH